MRSAACQLQVAHVVTLSVSLVRASHCNYRDGSRDNDDEERGLSHECPPTGFHLTKREASVTLRSPPWRHSILLTGTRTFSVRLRPGYSGCLQGCWLTGRRSWLIICRRTTVEHRYPPPFTRPTSSRRQ